MLPSAGKFLLRSSGNDPRIAEWLKAVDTRDVVTWKWHDRAMLVTAAAGRIAITPDDRTGSTSVLQFRAFRESDAEAEAQNQSRTAQVGVHLSEFARARKSLITKVAEYRRLENLMRVSAVFRWAEANGASFAGTEPELAGAQLRTPDGLVIAWDGSWISSAPGLSSEARTKQFCAKLPSVPDANLDKAPEDLLKGLLAEFVAYCRP
jgi:hypothetical protein